MDKRKQNGGHSTKTKGADKQTKTNTKTLLKVLLQ